MDEIKIDPRIELAAMQAVADAIEKLDGPAAERVLRWAREAHGLTGKPKTPEGRPDEGAPENGGPPARYETFAELYGAASPDTDVDRALVAGYWRQYFEGESDFGAQEINTALKNLGYGVPNITSALDALKNKKPALVVQLKKAGTTQQARKIFKLTASGKQAVEAMLPHE